MELQEAVGGLHARGPQQSSFYGDEQRVGARRLSIEASEGTQRDSATMVHAWRVTGERCGRGRCGTRAWSTRDGCELQDPRGTSDLGRRGLGRKPAGEGLDGEVLWAPRGKSRGRGAVRYCMGTWCRVVVRLIRFV